MGYLTAAVLNLVVLYLVNVRPGWEAVSFLADETTDVLPLVNLSILAGTLVNLVYVVTDTAVVKASGELATAVIALVVLVRIWQVWPFDFAGVWAGWRPLTYSALVVATAGVAIAIVVQLVLLARAVTGRTEPHHS